MDLGRNVGSFLDSLSPGGIPGIPGPFESIGYLGDRYGDIMGSTFNGINDHYNHLSNGRMDSYTLTDMAHEANFPHY
jgi:hypothetical protein